MRRFTFFVTLLAAAVTLAFSFAADDTFQGVVIKKPFDPKVHGKAARPNSNEMIYHGGPVMTSPSNAVYVIYYGTFVPTTQSIINDFLIDLSGSNPYKVNQTYNLGTPGSAFVPPTYYFFRPTEAPAPNTRSGSVYWDNLSQGAQLNSNSISKIVAHAIGTPGFPADPNGVYLVLTAPDVKIAGFCNSFCAYHTTSTAIVSGMHIRYALIPDPTQRCTGCNGGITVYGDTTTPNGDMGADTMTDDIMHELSETVTDPDLNAWYTASGAENADVCNYVYGTTHTESNAAGTFTYNFTSPSGGTVPARKYLIQLIWKNVTPGFCAASPN